MKKKFLCLMLTLVMVFSLVPSAVAANDEATQAAQTLYELGLFRGTGTNPDGTPIFALEQTPTRNQAVIMLVRLLGKEEEALAGNWELPFADVAKGSTAYPYIGYAYANGLTSGTTATTYSGTNPIKANQYITFVLRALGYESGKDFQVGTSYLLSDQLGITSGEYANASAFTRGDVAKISLNAHEVQEVVATAPYWGLPANIRWISEHGSGSGQQHTIFFPLRQLLPEFQQHRYYRGSRCSNPNQYHADSHQSTEHHLSGAGRCILQHLYWLWSKP